MEIELKCDFWLRMGCRSFEQSSRSCRGRVVSFTTLRGFGFRPQTHAFWPARQIFHGHLLKMLGI